MGSPNRSISFVGIYQSMLRSNIDSSWDIFRMRISRNRSALRAAACASSCLRCRWPVTRAIWRLPPGLGNLPPSKMNRKTVKNAPLDLLTPIDYTHQSLLPLPNEVFFLKNSWGNGPSCWIVIGGIGNRQMFVTGTSGKSRMLKKFYFPCWFGNLFSEFSLWSYTEIDMEPSMAFHSFPHFLT